MQRAFAQDADHRHGDSRSRGRGPSCKSCVVIGRERELERLRAFVSGGFTPTALVLDGEPGIGKTTLWEAGIAAARERGVAVRVARAGEAEAQLSFAALIDLAGGLDLGPLPAPQRAALEIALLRREPEGAPPQPHAIGLGLRNALAAAGPTLVAVDDIQWLDAPLRRGTGLRGAAAARRAGRVPARPAARRGDRARAGAGTRRRWSACTSARWTCGPRAACWPSGSALEVAPAAPAPDRRRHARQPAVRAGDRAAAGDGRRGRGPPGPARGRGPARHARESGAARCPPAAAGGRARLRPARGRARGDRAGRRGARRGPAGRRRRARPRRPSAAGRRGEGERPPARTS